MTAPLWWRDGVIYQIYPRSFADSNGDGVGDLAGIRARLGYLEWLGIDGIWLNPIHPSPNADWGYDVADYVGVHPDFGTLDDLDALVRDARARGIRVLLDIVPNHSSDQHPWFLESRSARDAAKRDWYVWAERPNNWTSIFGGPAWTLDDATGEYYLHNFLPEQPDLNWWSDDVRDAFDEVLRFWFDRGIAGFRIDVAHGLVKDRELRDHPLGPDGEELRVFSQNRPEVHDVFRRWRKLADGYDPAPILIGETWVSDPVALARFYGTGNDELHLAFNFPFVLSEFAARPLREVVEAAEAAIPSEGWPIWTMSNHDVVRFPTRWCGEDETAARAALVMLFGLRGTPVLYYGDEIAMPETHVPDDRRRDLAGRPSRDGARTPMHWRAAAEGDWWLPWGDTRRWNVESQRDDPMSPLSLTRDLIGLRRELPELRLGGYTSIAAPPGVWAWRRGIETTVAVNLSDDAQTVADAGGVIRIATDRDREGEPVEGSLELGPWEAAIVASGTMTA